MNNDRVPGRARRALTGIALSLTLLGAVKLPLCAQEAQQRPTVALVLAGGSAWGLAHIGVIKVLEDMGIPVDMVVGTSMGAIIGGFYATGLNSGELEEIALQTQWVELFAETNAPANESFFDSRDRQLYAVGAEFDRRGIKLAGGLVSGHKILRFVDTLTADIPAPLDFDTLPRRFRAVATDISTGQRVVISEGRLSDAMRSSMGVPGAFEPYLHQGRYLVDGFLVDNLPIAAARSIGADLVIAVDLVDSSIPEPEELTRTPLTTLLRTFDIMLRNNVNPQLPLADLILTVDVKDFIQADFSKTIELIERGEQTARQSIEQIAALRERTLSGSAQAITTEAAAVEATETASAPSPQHQLPRRLEATAIERIEIRGGDQKSQFQAARIFEVVRHRVPSARELQDLCAALDRAVPLAGIRVYRDSGAERPTLVVELKAPNKAGHALRLAVLYEATYSSYMTSNMILEPAVVLRGLTTADSRLTVNARLLDAPGLYIDFIQPFGKHFYAALALEAAKDFDTWITEDSLAYQFQTSSRSVSVALGSLPVPAVNLALAATLEFVDRERLSEVADQNSVDYALLLEGNLEVCRLNAPIFPMDGISARVQYRVSRTEWLSERNFAVLQTSGSTFLSLGTPFSVALLWTAGTDFSTSLTPDNAAPPFYKPDLSNRRLFPAPLTVGERIGSHVAGLGLEIKHQLNWSSRGITVPAFLILNAAAGSVIQDPEHFEWNSGLLHWNAAGGCGIRFSDAFGLAARAGISRNTANQYTPFISLDLGAIGY